MDSSVRDKRAGTLTLIGVAIMFLMTLTKIAPSSTIVGYSLFVGVAFFFIVESAAKTPADRSGLRFKTFFADLRKPGVMLWVLLPVASCIVTLIAGKLLFGGEFVAHVLGRTASVLSFDKLPLLVVQMTITALGEEIAFRGFLVGKSMKLYPFWPCALFSSALFAAAHIATGQIGLVLFDVGAIFIDGLIYCVIYKKAGNCLVSTLSHILCNATGFALAFMFYM